jgi:hypothetical protein
MTSFENEVRPGFDYKPYHIVGIVKDFNIQSCKDVEPIIFSITEKQNGSDTMFIIFS